MARLDPSKQRKWGKGKIAGGRHAFRIGMVKRKFRKFASPPARVLDAGCGDGTLTLALLAAGYDMQAVDASELCIERLNSELEFIYSDATPKGIACVSRLESLPFSDNEFDAAVSGEVLEHLDDDFSAVEELNRVIKPGGNCIVTVPANPVLYSLEDEWAGHKRRYLKTDLVRLFDSNGFDAVDVHHWGWPITYLYNRIVFQAWLTRKLAEGDPDEEGTESIGQNPLVIWSMYAAFSIDRLFQALPYGIGLCGVFKKRAP